MSTTGVTYYKLEKGYPGDVTKGCGLSGSEIDKNFNFLRGYDIKDASLDQRAGTITLKRVSGEEIVIEGLTEYVEGVIGGNNVKINEEESHYDRDRYQLHIVLDYNDGSKGDYVIGGLVIEGDKVYTGYGLYGDGKITNPVALNPVYKTGFFKAAKALIDCTEEGNALPENKLDGDRYVTKEKVSKFGLEYNSVALNDIIRRLAENGKGWRVPTADDWNGLLNGAEDCDWRNHGESTDSGYYGKDAGFRLKDGSWEEETFVGNGFGVVPTESTTLGLKSKFWSSTTDKIREVTQKVFTQNEGRIYQKGGDNQLDQFACIRLVRDYDGRPVLDSEEIDGMVYDCSGFTHILDNVETKKIWTLQNVCFTRYIQSGNARPTEITSDEAEEYAYFINEYNDQLGEWLKKRLEVDDVIVIDGSEYILEPSGELVNRTERSIEGILSGITEELNRIEDRIDDVEESVSDEIDRLDAEDSEIWSAITEINDFGSSLTEAIEAEEERAKAREDEIAAEAAAAVDAEEERAKAREDEIAADGIKYGDYIISAVDGVSIPNIGGDKALNLAFDGDFSAYNPNNQDDGWTLNQ